MPVVFYRSVVHSLGFFIKGVFRSYCCYGNLLRRENDNTVFTNDWANFWYRDCSEVIKQVISDSDKASDKERL